MPSTAMLVAMGGGGKASAPLFAPESGRLTASGTHVYMEDGQPWRCRGVSMFLHPLRFMIGRSVLSDFEWARHRGRNELRVFMDALWSDWYGDGELGDLTNAELALWKRPWESIPDFANKLHAYFRLAASQGIRIKATVHTYDFDRDSMRAYMQLIYDISQDHWNVRVQGANEAENNGIDVQDIYAGVDSHGVLSDFGNDPERHCDGAPDEAAWTACMHREVPTLDTGANHDLVRNIQSSRKPKDCLEFSGVFGVPFEWEEPVGVVEENDPLMNPPDGDGFMSHKSGGGVRTINKDVIYSAECVAAFYGVGMTYHPEVGAREGRAPGQAEPLQDEVAAMLGQIAQFLPQDIATGGYCRPNFGDFGLAWTDGDTDSKVGHAYGSLHGNVQYVVVPMPSDGWTPVPVNGWRIAAVGPVPYLLRLER